jgi:hypothetical protein
MDSEKTEMKKFKLYGVLAVGMTLSVFAFACNTSWIQTAEQYIQVLTPAIEDVVGILALAGVKGVSSTQINQVSSYASQATTDLQDIDTLLQQYNSADAATTAQKITAAANDAKANLNLILPALHITDPTTVSKVDSAVSLAVDTITQLVALIPASPSTTPTLNLAAKAPTPSQLQKQFNSIFAW